MSESSPIHEPTDPKAEAVERAVEAAHEILRSDFEGPNALREMPYHNEAHTLEIEARVSEILHALWDGGAPITDTDRQRGRLLAAWHDTFQHSAERVDLRTERKLLVRFPGADQLIYEGDENTPIASDRSDGHPGNERYSIEAAKEWMRQYNLAKGVEIFSPDDIEAMESIAATVPAFDTENHTVVQNHLSRETPIVGWALAVADIGTAGMRGGEAYIRDGNALFREERLHVPELLDTFDTLTDSRKETLRLEMLEWSESQIAFAKGRKQAFENELALLTGRVPASAIENVRRLFNKFDESVESSQQEYTVRAQLSFEELAARMGYDMPHLDARKILEG